MELYRTIEFDVNNKTIDAYSVNGQVPASIDDIYVSTKQIAKLFEIEVNHCNEWFYNNNSDIFNKLAVRWTSKRLRLKTSYVRLMDFVGYCYATQRDVGRAYAYEITAVFFAVKTDSGVNDALMRSDEYIKFIEAENGRLHTENNRLTFELNALQYDYDEINNKLSAINQAEARVIPEQYRSISRVFSHPANRRF